MVSLREVLEDIDLPAIALPDDKLDECKYFFSLLEQESDRNKFRWLLSAFLGACYSCIEIKARQLYHAFNDPETGETYKDEESLDILHKFVKTQQGKKNPYYVNTSGINDIVKRLYEIRHGNTHSYALSILLDGDASPNNFFIGHKISEKVPAIEFCQDVMGLLEKIYSQT